MSTWRGWQSDLLEHASLPDTRLNRSFLTAWSKSQPTKCNRNPLFISRSQPGSTRCRRDAQTGRWARNYLSIASAWAAFNEQIHSGEWPHLLSALESGNPYSVKDAAAGDVAHDLGMWGSHAFARTYFEQQQTPVTGISAPQGLAGWKALRRSINKGMPDTLNYATRVNKQTLRTLHRARKVRV